MIRFKRTAITVAATVFSIAATADPQPLTTFEQCSEGTQNSGISVSDVTGNNGGATDCWGAYTGNDSVNDGFVIEDPDSVYDGVTFDFVAKDNIGGSLEGEDIGLTVPGGAARSGTWAFDEGALDGHDFLIVLKAANSPGFAAWLFAGNPDATSFSGAWDVAWNKDLSHLSVYKSTSPPFTPPNGVPSPTPLPLIVIGLVLWAANNRKK